MITVKAIKKGFDGMKRRRPKEIFELHDRKLTNALQIKRKAIGEAKDKLGDKAQQKEVSELAIQIAENANYVYTAEEQFSKKWMERVEDGTVAPSNPDADVGFRDPVALSDVNPATHAAKEPVKTTAPDAPKTDIDVI